MSETQVKAKRKVHRSPNYPALSLGDAIERARRVYDAEKRTPASADTILAHLGYKPGAGPGYRALSALRHYGLLEEHSGQDRISDAAFHILTLSETSPDRQQALRETALRPTLFQQVWEHYKGQLPSDLNLRDYLIKTHSFNPDSVASFVKALRETIELAKLGPQRANVAEAQTPDRSEMEDQQPTRQDRTRGEGLRISPADTGKPSAMQTVFLMRLKDGTVVELRASGELADEHGPAIKNLIDMALGVASRTK